MKLYYLIRNRTKVFLALLLLVGLVMTGSTVTAASPEIELCAVPGNLSPLPTTNPLFSMPVWGFGIPSVPGDCSTAVASVPGPQLEVNEGDTVTLHVTNNLPGTRVVQFETPGISFNAGPNQAASGATVDITFTASAPGTYLYQSGGDGGRQAAMGLYGMLIVRSMTAGQAYDQASTAYDVEAPLVLGAMDPAFNANPDTFDMYAYKATYWMVNGRAYPDSISISALVNQRVLLRYANAGYDNTAMELVGIRENVVGQDARMLNNPYGAVSEILPAGSTKDAIVTVPASAPPSVNGFAIFNRQLHVTNGVSTDTNFAPGGMFVFLKPQSGVDVRSSGFRTFIPAVIR